MGTPEQVSRCPQPAARHGHAATLGNEARPGGRLGLALKLLSGHVHYGPFPILGQGTAGPPPTLACYLEKEHLGASSSHTCSLPSWTPGPPWAARLFGNGDRQEAREGALPGPPWGTETPAQAFLLPLPHPRVHSSPHSSRPLAAVRCPDRHGLSAGLWRLPIVLHTEPCENPPGGPYCTQAACPPRPQAPPRWPCPVPTLRWQLPSSLTPPGPGPRPSCSSRP